VRLACLIGRAGQAGRHTLAQASGELDALPYYLVPTRCRAPLMPLVQVLAVQVGVGCDLHGQSATVRDAPRGMALSRWEACKRANPLRSECMLD
jgi:hypothetical protein